MASSYPPSGRNKAREMMCRCTSLVPSQMRSMRASRQMRSSGRSLISPMNPQELAQKLSQVLPTAIDRLTPEGKVPGKMA